MAVEIVLFGGAGLLIGRFGATQLAAHQISMSICSVTFMVPLSISQAGQCPRRFLHGRRLAACRADERYRRVPARGRLHGGDGDGSVVDASVVAGLYITTGDSSRGDVIAVAAQLLTIAAFFQVFDGAQTIAAGALRGLKDTRVPAVVAAIGYWGLGFLPAWDSGRQNGLWRCRNLVRPGLRPGGRRTVLSARFWLLSGRLIAAQTVATAPPSADSPAKYATQH